MRARARPALVYALMVVVGAAAFLYPFWLPQDALPSQAHGADARPSRSKCGGAR